MKKAGSPTAAQKTAIGNLPTSTKVPQSAPGVNTKYMQESQKDSKQLPLDRMKELAEEHGALPKGERPARDIAVPVRDENGGHVTRGTRMICGKAQDQGGRGGRFVVILGGQKGIWRFGR